MTPAKCLFAAVCFCAALLGGCASVPQEAGFDSVERMVAEREPYRLHWDRGTAADLEVERSIDEWLQKELSVDAAVQIALLNNPRLQAVYEELGVTQSDVVEAGLLENPVLFGQVRFPDQSDAATNYEFDITQNFLDLLMLPARKSLAGIHFEQTQLKVADEVVQVAAEVRRSYYGALGALQLRDLQQEIALAAADTFELAQRMRSAGNISDLQLARERSQFEEARLRLSGAEIDLLQAREALTRLMGLWGNRSRWRLSPRLPELPEPEMPLDGLESLAIGNRLDLAAERREVEALAQALGIVVDWRWVGRIEVGISTERETDKTWLTGPSLAIELPIFNQRQADIARLEAQLRRSQKLLTAQAVQIRSEVRLLRDRMMMVRDRVLHYRQTILPLRERIVHLTLQNYNYMLIGAFELILAKREEFEAYRGYLESLRDYWILRAELRRVLGGALPASDPAAGGRPG
jgi:cobalt-zinc-cadmium efflux system outer membrane protein